MKKKSGTFISFEGTDGVGKSTQIRLLQDWLLSRGHKVHLTREPGGGPLAEKIRELLLDPKIKMEPFTELFLYQASRVEHVNKVIKPWIMKGDVVLCDRFTDATVAYQGYGRRLPLFDINFLNKLATGTIQPKLTFWLDLPPKKGVQNVQKRKGPSDRIEAEGVSFQEKVRKGYLALSRKESKRVIRVVVQKEIDQTQQILRKWVEKKLGL